MPIAHSKNSTEARNRAIFTETFINSILYMEKTLVLLKPSCVQRQLIGEIVNRFERRGLRVAGMKMMQLSDEILRDH